jgi:hypothetical protein
MRAVKYWIPQMRPSTEILDRINKEGRIVAGGRDDDDGFAALYPRRNKNLRLIAAWGEGWEHVSVSLADRCPTWDEMQFVKEMFWRDEEAVMQLHPPKSTYINVHPYVLHLWRPTGGGGIPLPPLDMV